MEAGWGEGPAGLTDGLVPMLVDAARVRLHARQKLGPSPIGNQAGGHEHELDALTLDATNKGEPTDRYQALRLRVRAWLAGRGKGLPYAEWLLLPTDLLHLMCKLVADPRVPLAHKAQLAAAIVYLISPLDLIPEMLLGPVGYADDLALAAFVLNRVINAGQGALAEEHWAGDERLLPLLQRILARADSALGAGLWKKLRRFVRR